MHNLRFWLWLALTGKCGTIRAERVLKHFKTPQAAFTAKRKDYEQVEGIRGIDIDLFCNKSLEEADRVIETCKNKDIKIVTAEDDEFPERLKFIEPMPILLYVRGEIPKETNGLCISIVGTRNCSEYGAAAAKNISYGLAKCGAVVVSGMAKGIDTIANKSAIKAAGQTIAVLGSGVDFIYPYENKMLYEEIIQSGAVISEFPPMTKPDAGNFPIRNRIISGLSLGTVVVESDEKGGSMITARLALEQGRDVFAVPGQINSGQSRGTNELIKQGAKLVTCAEDVLEEYIYAFRNLVRFEKSGEISVISNNPFEDIRAQVASRKEEYRNKADIIDEMHRKVYDVLTDEPQHISDISVKANLLAQETAAALIVLELESKALSLAGGYYKIKYDNY